MEYFPLIVLIIALIIQYGFAAIIQRYWLKMEWSLISKCCFSVFIGAVLANALGGRLLQILLF
jgi:hypothetical protein